MQISCFKKVYSGDAAGKFCDIRIYWRADDVSRSCKLDDLFVLPICDQVAQMKCLFEVMCVVQLCFAKVAREREELVLQIPPDQGV